VDEEVDEHMYDEEEVEEVEAVEVEEEEQTDMKELELSVHHDID
jgi:predicted RNA-binding protein YlqC (UPF0109 family)